MSRGARFPSKQNPSLPSSNYISKYMFLIKSKSFKTLTENALLSDTFVIEGILAEVFRDNGPSFKSNEFSFATEFWDMSIQSPFFSTHNQTVTLSAMSGCWGTHWLKPRYHSSYCSDNCFISDQHPWDQTCQNPAQPASRNTLPQTKPLPFNYKTIRNALIDRHQPRNLPTTSMDKPDCYFSFTNTMKCSIRWPMTNGPAKVAWVRIEPYSHLVTDNSGTMFRRIQRILKLVDYTATPEQSSKAAITLHHLTPPSSLPNASKPPTKCVCFAEPLLLIDYRTMTPVPSVADATATYPELDLWDRDVGEVTPKCPLPWDRDLIIRKVCQRKPLDQSLTETQVPPIHPRLYQKPSMSYTCDTKVPQIPTNLTFLVMIRPPTVTLRMTKYWPTSNSHQCLNWTILRANFWMQQCNNFQDYQWMYPKFSYFRAIYIHSLNLLFLCYHPLGVINHTELYISGHSTVLLWPLQANVYIYICTVHIRP